MKYTMTFVTGLVGTHLICLYIGFSSIGIFTMVCFIAIIINWVIWSVESNINE